MIERRTRESPSLAGLPVGCELVELTATDKDAAEALFRSRASATEQRTAERLPPARAALYRHAHGALLARPASYRSLSYAGDRAWAVFSSAPVGLDVVASAQDGALDPAFVTLRETALAGGQVAGFPPQLAVWAAKEAAAKLTGDVRREPEHWRLWQRKGRLLVLSDAQQPALVFFTRPAFGLLACVAVYAETHDHRGSRHV